jgi:hypothetical protein
MEIVNSVTAQSKLCVVELNALSNRIAGILPGVFLELPPVAASGKTLN